MPRIALVGLVAGLLAVLASSGRASLWHPEDPMAIPVSAKGEPQALPFTEFSRRRLVLRNIGNPDWPLIAQNPNTKQPIIDPSTGQPRLTERGAVAERIKTERQKPNLSPEESVALAVDLLRFGRADDAAGVLRNQRTGFLANVTLAHVAIAQNSRDHPTWADALNYLYIANDERPPTSLPGLTPQQIAWQLKLNRGPLTKLIKLRMAEARGPKSPPDDELPDAIFDVNFANSPGGLLAPAEAAKLPPDALATVQQLVLWFPQDTRLYWLLAEVYAAKGEYAAAEKMLDECVRSMKYSNRKLLMQHREAIMKAAEAKGAAPDAPLIAPGEDPPVEDPPAPPPDVPFSMGAVWIYFGVVAVIALFALARAMTKKRKGATERGRIG